MNQRFSSMIGFGTPSRLTVEFEMEPANGNGWAELQHDGSLEGEIRLISGDDIPFIARR